MGLTGARRGAFLKNKKARAVGRDGRGAVQQFSEGWRREKVGDMHIQFFHKNSHQYSGATAFLRGKRCMAGFGLMRISAGDFSENKITAGTAQGKVIVFGRDLLWQDRRKGS